MSMFCNFKVFTLSCTGEMFGSTGPRGKYTRDTNTLYTYFTTQKMYKK